MHRPARSLIPVTALVLLLTGCTAGDEPEPAASSSVSSEEAQAAQETTEALRAGAGEDADEQQVTAALPVLGSRETTAGSTPLRVDLNDVSVSGEVMTVLFTVRNLAEDGGNWQVATTFDDGTGTAPLDDEGLEQTEEHSTQRAFTTDGVTVLDPVNGRLHRAAYDTSGTCACTVDLANAHIGPGNALVLTTSFAALPEDVDSVTVQIPRAGSFDDVPVRR